MANPDLQMNPQMEQINGEIRDNFRALADGFQKLDKIEDSIKQSRLLEDLTEKMRECKRLIEEFDREIKVHESRSPPEVSKKLMDEKQSMIKALNSYMSFIKIYQNILGNKKVELFIMEAAGSSEPMAEDKARVSSEMLYQELNPAGNKTMNEMDHAIERSKTVVYQPVVLGIQTAATLNGQVGLVSNPDTIQVNQVCIKKETQPVAEIELQKTKRKGKRKVDETNDKPKRQVMHWTTEEEVTLAERWRDATENGVVGNSQTGESLWSTIRDHYNRLVDWKRKRNVDQITGKWTKLQRDIKLFCTIYNDYNKGRRSGANEADVMEAARSGYKNKTGRPFGNEAAWRVVKDCPKFFSPEGVIGNKRRRQPPEDLQINRDEGGQLRIHTNPNSGHLFAAADDVICRPPVRGLSRKSPESSGSSDDASSHCSSHDVRYETVKTQQERQKTSKVKRICTAFKMLNTPINPNLPPDEQKFLSHLRELVKRTLPQLPPEQEEGDTNSN